MRFIGTASSNIIFKTTFLPRHIEQIITCPTVGSSCSILVERMPHNIEDVGWNPVGCWAFFYISILSVKGPHEGAALQISL